MIPIYLDPTAVTVGLVGRGALAVRRLGWLRALGAEPLVFAPAPEPAFAEAAGAALIPRLPDAADLARLAALWVADLPPSEADPLATQARAAGVLVNVEDVKPLCDFHTPAVVRRGGLLLAAGTGGASPAVASAVRARLEEMFPAAWEEALAEIADARLALQRAGASPAEIAADARERLSARGLFTMS